MNKFKKIVVIALAFAIVFSFNGCTKGKNSEGKDSSSAQKSAEKNKSIPNKLQDPNISILSFSDPETEVALGTAIKTFEEKYGGKVNYIRVLGPEVSEKLITLTSAGDAPDLTTFSLGHMPTFIVKGLIQPIDDYLDTKDPVWNMNAMKQFKYKGKYYGFNRDVVGWFIFYNKTMFDNNGVKTPLEYFNEGNWNFDTFRDCAIKLTQDTDKAGRIDQWGFVTISPYLFTYANGAEYVKYEDDGNITLNINDAKVIETFQFLQDGYTKDKFIDTSNVAWEDRFIQGKVAMVDRMKGALIDRLTNEMKYEWDVVPFPVGPSGTKGVIPGGTGNWALATGAKNPHGGAVWAYMYAKLKKEIGDDRLAQLYTPEQLKRINEAEENVVFTKHEGIGSLKQEMVKAIFNPLKKGTPVHTVVDQATPVLQTQIDMVIDK